MEQGSSIGNGIEKDIKHTLGVREKRTRRLRMVSLTDDNFDDLLQFTRNRTETSHLTRQHLAFYQIYLRTSRYNGWGDPEYCQIPPTIGFDASHTLMLFADFVRPTGYSRDLQGLAVSGFNSAACIPHGDSSGEVGQTLDIAQYQTGFQNDEKEMFHYLGFIRYRELFTHMVEQVAWHLKHKKKQPVTHVSIQKEMTCDWKLPFAHRWNPPAELIPENENDPSAWNKETLQKLNQARGKEIKKIQEARLAWIQTLGYTMPLVVKGRGVELHESMGKLVTDIAPDHRFQAQLKKLSRD